MDPSGISNRDGNARRFTWGSIPRYFRDRPAEIRALLEAAGPNAAARGAFWYSLAWCVVMFLVYFWMSFVTGLFSVPDYVGGEQVNGLLRVTVGG